MFKITYMALKLLHSNKYHTLKSYGYRENVAGIDWLQAAVFW
jgi:hypothetical protein